MRPIPWLLAVTLAGCTAELVTPMEASEGDVHDDVFRLASAEEIAAELDASPAHLVDDAFVRATVLYRANEELPLEIATSSDGETWSEWDVAIVSPEESDDEVGVYLADAFVADGDARFWRMRLAAGAQPEEIAVVTSTLDDLTAEIPTDEDEIAAIDPVLVEEDGITPIGSSGLRRYRFDFGSVTRPWLWLLRAARRRGWRGSLYGERTGLRTYQQQLQLWNDYQAGRGAPAFPPWGPSRHLIRNVARVGRWYQAVDTSYVPDLIRIARGLGVSLHLPYSGEPWHVEATRSFSAPRGWNP